MKLQLVRFATSPRSTLGALYSAEERPAEEVDAGSDLHRLTFLCFTLEDAHHAAKISGETRIPEGTYRVVLRRQGGFHARYAKRFPSAHRGMLWLQGVPGFQWILIHCGNTVDDTMGCILVGDVAHGRTPRGAQISESTQAYRRIYPALAEAAGKDELTISIEDAG